MTSYVCFGLHVKKLSYVMLTSDMFGRRGSISIAHKFLNFCLRSSCRNTPRPADGSRTLAFFGLVISETMVFAMLCGVKYWPKALESWPSIRARVDRGRAMCAFTRLTRGLGGQCVYNLARNHENPARLGTNFGAQGKLCRMGLAATRDFCFAPGDAARPAAGRAWNCGRLYSAAPRRGAPMAPLGEDARRAAADAVRAHDTLAGMDYSRATIGDVAAEWGRMREAVRRLGGALEADSGDTASSLAAHAARYLSGYAFSRELGLIAATYGEDRARVRAIGLKIAESLADCGMVSDLREAADG